MFEDHEFKKTEIGTGMNTFYILRAQTRVAVLHQIALN
jgi:hypothetical protein